MTKKDFWRNSVVAVIGGGSWGTVLAELAAKNASEVRVWMRNADRVRDINEKHQNEKYVPGFSLSPNVKASTDLKTIFSRNVNAVIWALPSKVCREMSSEFAHYLKGDEVILHATKGVERNSLKRISTVLEEELPCPRIGVISGPNLALEIASGKPAATVVASAFDEVILAGAELLRNPKFRVYGSHDVVGVEWAGTLKNVLAISGGILDAMGLGWNARAMLISLGLAEIVRFGVAMGAKQETFLGLAGVGDLLATCSSTQSRNYQLGFRLGKGMDLETALNEMGSTVEGVQTVRSVWHFASDRGVSMPITEGVYRLVEGEGSVQDVIDQLMARAAVDGGGIPTYENAL